jgi:hypothetical protein
MVVVRRPVRSAEVAVIAGIEDPVLRNLWITHAYHEWGVALSRLMGDDDISWCGFGTWASKSAGRTIRGDELPGLLRDVIDQSENLETTTKRVGRFTGFLSHLRLTERLELSHLFGVADRVADQISGQVARGNLLVFIELGPILAGLVEAFERRPRPTVDDYDTVVQPLIDANLAQGVDGTLVEQALRAWWAAVFDTDPGSRSQHVLEGNIATVLHEQQRLQDAIAGALDAAVTFGFQAVAHDLIRAVALSGALHRILDRMLGRLSAEIEEEWRHVVTEELTTLVTPDETLRLGRDLPSLGRGVFPASLMTLLEPSPNDLWTAWNRAQPDLRGTAAKDWSLLDQRMNYIVNLFRSRQQHHRLLDPPFTDAQLTVMALGQLPERPL